GDGNSRDLKLPFAIGREHLGGSQPGLFERGPNWLEHVAIAHDVEQRCAGGNGRSTVQVFEGRIADGNVLGGIDDQQTVSERSKYGPDLSGIFCDLAIERALAVKDFLQSATNAARVRSSGQKECRRLLASSNCR